MNAHRGFPGVEFLFQAKKQVLLQIAERGQDALVAPADAWLDGLSGTFTLGTYLQSVEKMIEALTPLLDFEKEPLSREGKSDMLRGLALKNQLGGSVGVSGHLSGFVISERQ